VHTIILLECGVTVVMILYGVAGRRVLRYNFGTSTQRPRRIPFSAVLVAQSYYSAALVTVFQYCTSTGSYSIVTVLQYSTSIGRYTTVPY
jgi:hypothetical protein